VIQRVPDRPGVYYDHHLGYVRKAPGVVFFDEELVRAARGLERQFFYDLEGKDRTRSKREPPLYSSFCLRSRLRHGESVVVDRLRVTLSDPHGWAIDLEVGRWFAENARLEVDVNRRVLVDDFLGILFDEGYRLPPAHRFGGGGGRAISPRDPITSEDEIGGKLTVLRDPGERDAAVIMRVEAVGAWLMEARER